MKKIYIVMVTSLLVLCVASTSMAWTLVYANDPDGNATYGNIQTLIDSVNAGKAVRYMIENVDGSKAFLQADVAWVRNNIVYAQSNNTIASSFQGDLLNFTSDVYTIHFISDTRGNLIATHWLVGTHTRVAPDAQLKRSLKWFVD